jgi:hypothetical protein
VSEGQHDCLDIKNLVVGGGRFACSLGSGGGAMLRRKQAASTVTGGGGQAEAAPHLPGRVVEKLPRERQVALPGQRGLHVHRRRGPRLQSGRQGGGGAAEGAAWRPAESTMEGGEGREGQRV